MTHPFMEAVSGALFDRGVATLRYQFPYMETGSSRPDRPEVAHAAVRAAVAAAKQRFPGIRLVAGGKSFGARMTSQAHSIQPLQGVEGLAFFGFPLHPAGKPSVTRADHLSNIAVPLLFLQGTNDKLADLKLLQPMIRTLNTDATLQTVQNADHSFHVPKRSGRSDGQILDEIVDVFASWAELLPTTTSRSAD
jgi:predicted alpha/beta-hydrolase family hydrolase